MPAVPSYVWVPHLWIKINMHKNLQKNKSVPRMFRNFSCRYYIKLGDNSLNLIISSLRKIIFVFSHLRFLYFYRHKVMWSYDMKEVKLSRRKDRKMSHLCKAPHWKIMKLLLKSVHLIPDPLVWGTLAFFHLLEIWAAVGLENDKENLIMKNRSDPC